MPSMNSYTQAERAMKVQEVMLEAMAKKISWWQAAEILGISDRHTAFAHIPDLRVDRDFNARYPVQDTARYGCFQARSNLRQQVPHSLADRVRMRPQPRQLLT
jgi:hypothetical protein